MDPRHLFVDERLTAMCVYCGGEPTTRDHVPSRVLLDKPYPANLPVVDACEKCNKKFSIHEQYFACLIECALTGSVEPNGVERIKISRILEGNPKLRTRLLQSRKVDEYGNLFWEVESDRVKSVLIKLARGHAAFELSLLQLEDPDVVSFTPFVYMSDEQRVAFESPLVPSVTLWP
ncbi:hypothetical protein ACFLRB_05925, partial [Acidobacteriota bacterium]